MRYSNTALKELSKRYKNILIKCAMLNATALLVFVMPASAGVITQREQITENTTYTDLTGDITQRKQITKNTICTDLTAENITSTTANNGGVFYLEDVQDTTLTFKGTTIFKNNSLNGGGMGGAIGNGWLSTKDSEKWPTYTPGGKIVFDGATSFEGNTTDNTNGAGAIFNYGVGTTISPDITFNDIVAFTGNKATTSSASVYVGGGAINSRGGAIVFNKAATFTGNESASKGGAIMNAGIMMFEDTVEFNNNTAKTSGGALAILGGDVTFKKTASFTGNSAATGSAISMDQANAKVTFKDTATFKNNTGTATLWNNSSTGEVYFENGATFDSNTNTANGTLQNAGLVEVKGGNLKFTNNTGSNGGGLKNSGTVTVETTGNVLFDTNTTTSSAGALDNGGTVTMTSNKITFNNNKANAGYGGAIFNSADISFLGKENIFTNNTAEDTKSEKSGGGAIHNRGNVNSTTLVVGTSESVNTFENNTSKAHGGAILSRAFDGDTQNAEATINGTTTFANNTATLNGGAIWNASAEKNGSIGTTSFTLNGEISFTANTANGLGGAVYNNSEMAFNGTTVFTKNQDRTGANDIYNDGTITFNGDVTLDGGISGNGIITFAQGASLTAELQKTTIIANTVTFQGDNTLNLIVANGLANADYDFISTSTDLEGEEKVKISDNAVYNLKLTDKGQINVSVKSGEEIVASSDTPMTIQEADILSAILTSNGNSTNIGNQVASAIANAMQSGNTGVAVEAAKQASPTTAQVVIGVAKEAANTVAKLSTNRIDNIKGTSGGDITEGAGLWMQALYNHTKQEATASSDGFKANSRGLALGVDKEITNSTVLGIGYGYMNTDVDSFGRDVTVDGHNFFIYGKYQPSSWYVSSVLNYNYSKYTEKKAPLGISLRSEYDVNSYGANIMTGYDMKHGLTPEAGLRYLVVDADSYFDGAQRIRSKRDDVLTAVAGIKYATQFKSKGIYFKPTARLAATYDVVSDNSHANVAVIGGSNYAVDGSRLHRFGVEAGAGITASINNIDLTLEYNGAFRQDYRSQGGMLRARYNF